MGMPSEGSWTPFVAEIKTHLGLDVNYLPKRQKITLFYKDGRRTILNYDEMKQHLERRFRVEVEIVNPAIYTLPEQVRMLQDTTVVVSPCGGISFSSVFLPVRLLHRIVSESTLTSTFATERNCYCLSRVRPTPVRMAMELIVNLIAATVIGTRTGTVPPRWNVTSTRG